MSPVMRRTTVMPQSGRTPPMRFISLSSRQFPVQRHVSIHLIRPRQQRRRDRKAEGLRGLEVEDELKLRRLYDRQVGGFGAFQNLVDLHGRGAVATPCIGSVAHAR